MTANRSGRLPMTDFEIPHLATINSLPSGLLYPHQADGVSFLMSKGRAILGDDMGLGKTRQAIVGMQIAAPTGMILIVCPASLKLNWRREIRMVNPGAKIEVLGVADGEQSDPRWVIMNYDLLAKHAAFMEFHGPASFSMRHISSRRQQAHAARRSVAERSPRARHRPSGLFVLAGD
jgi:SNF2 family DNA or RNA helicase